MIRVYDTARTIHFERLSESASGELIYRYGSYDFDAALARAAGASQLNLAQILLRLCKTQGATIELNEPLHFRSWRTVVPILLLLRLTRVVAGRRNFVVAYAIENLDPSSAIGARFGPLRRFVERAARWATLAIVHQYDRVAYGTQQAADLYSSYVLPSIDSSLFEALPARCNCVVAEADRDLRSFVFVGSFESRKGIEVLLSAWRIAASAPGFSASLTVMGKGPLADLVRVTASEIGASVVFKLDPPRSEIHAVLRRSERLVLISESSERWREQVGLPIVEALSHGLQVVTSTATGLRSWLSAHGHIVVDEDLADEDLAALIVTLSKSPISAEQQLSMLPQGDQRLAADEWLHRAIDRPKRKG